MIEEKLTPLICPRFLHEEKYRQGHIRIINALPGRRILGLHLPEMKQVAKELAQQTDVLDVLHAYEQFEPWCVNKNILKSYDYDISDDFLMDRDENEASALDKLNSMIGLGIVKEKIAEIIATDQVEKERKNHE